MIDHSLDKTEGILIVRPSRSLQRSDFEDLASAVDPYLEEAGVLNGLMICTPDFPGWEDFGALVSHFRFVRNHHERIERVALVTDAPLISHLPSIASHFVHADVRHFEYCDEQAARAWLNGGD